MGFAALIALAVPLSIARSSLVGAYVVLAVLAAIAIASVLRNRRAREAVDTGAAPRRSTALVRIAVLTAAYAVLVAVVHATG